MAIVKFIASVIGTAAGATAILGGIVKTLHVLQTKASMTAAAKTFASKY